MDGNELKYLWASPENGIAPERAKAFAASAVAKVNRERRRRRGFLVYISIVLSLVTVLTAWQWTRQLWPATLVLAAQWIAMAGLWRIFRRSPAAMADRPIRQTIETLLERVRSRCRELQVLLGLFLIAVPLIGLAIFQLQQNGKMRPHEAASASLLFGAILLGMSGWFLFDLFARKLPEQRHLEALLREYC